MRDKDKRRIDDSPTHGEDTSVKEKAKEETRGPQYHCDYCRADITHTVCIRCAECKDFDLCLSCFAQGIEIFPHQNDHKYRVMDHVTTPIFDKEWGADEELLLLEAIEMFGYGNWGEVAEHVGGKTKTQCEEHYYNIYLNSRTAPLPDLEACLGREPGGPGAGLGDRDKTDKPKPKVKAKTKTKQKQTKASLGHLVGYQHNRGDFDVEYENDAEMMLCDMEFKPADTTWERELKLRVISIYNSKLDSRAEMKKLILSRNLLNRRDKKRPKEEREIFNAMKPFARFQSAEEHDELVEGMIREQRLRKRIAYLQQCRLQGMRTLPEGELEGLKKKEGHAGPGRPPLAATLAAQAARDELLPPPSALAASAAMLAATAAGNVLDPLPKRKRPNPATASATSTSTTTTGATSTTAPPPIQAALPEGLELLSEDERTLAAAIELTPREYISIKAKLLSEALSRGFLNPAAPTQHLEVEVSKTDKIMDFFIRVGWPTSLPDEPASSSSSSSSVSSSTSASSTSTSVPMQPAPVKHYQVQLQTDTSATIPNRERHQQQVLSTHGGTGYVQQRGGGQGVHGMDLQLQTQQAQHLQASKASANFVGNKHYVGSNSTLSSSTVPQYGMTSMGMGMNMGMGTTIGMSNQHNQVLTTSSNSHARGQVMPSHQTYHHQQQSQQHLMIDHTGALLTPNPFTSTSPSSTSSASLQATSVGMNSVPLSSVPRASSSPSPPAVHRMQQMLLQQQRMQIQQQQQHMVSMNMSTIPMQSTGPQSTRTQQQLQLEQMHMLQQQQPSVGPSSEVPAVGSAGALPHTLVSANYSPATSPTLLQPYR